MGKQVLMQVEEQHPTPKKPKAPLHKRISKPKPIKMSVQKAVNKIKKLNHHQSPSTSPSVTDIKKISIFRELKRSLIKNQSENKQKLSKGKKRRGAIRDKLNFRRRLDESIMGKVPVVGEEGKKEGMRQGVGRSHGMKAEERARQQKDDISNMKTIMGNSVFKSSPLGSLKQHLSSVVQRKMQVE